MVLPTEEVSPELALELRLLALATEGQTSAAAIQGLSRLAQGLGNAGYEAIGPLELLYRRRAHWVRVAVVRALGQLPYPRAFRLLIQALSDSEPSVVRQAQRSIAGMRNPQLLESVLGLIASGAYARGYPQDKEFFETRRAAIEALAGIAAPQARDALRWIREQGSLADRRILGEVLGDEA
jgi:HEAT repeat protein